LPAAQLLVLAATRRSAADLRDRVAARLPGAERPAVRTPASVAFAVLANRAAVLGEPAPVLVSGPEQDLALAELLAGHAAGEGRPPPWPPSVRPAVALRAFRGQLRDLLMRAAERGLAPAELAELGRRQARPEWVAAAEVYAEYLDTLVLRQTTPDAGARLDPAVVVDEAVGALRAWERELPGAPRPRWRLVLVDDHQESTAAVGRLLSVLAGDGARVVLAGDPDAAVLTFRGAQPALLGRAAVPGAGPGELGAQVCALGTSWRQPAALRAVTAQVTERIGTVGAVAQRAAVAPDAQGSAAEVGPDGRRSAGTDTAVQVALLPSAAQEAAFVAHHLRTAHLRRAVPWRELVVLARSGAKVAATRRALAAAGVPVTVLGSDTALRDEPACRPLLTALGVVTGADPLDLETASALLCGPLGGLDPLGLRRVRRALRAAEVAGGGSRSSEQLVVELVGSTGQVPQLPPALARPVERLGRVLEAGRAAARTAGADARGVLWALWDTAGLAASWRRVALAGGTAGERADRDLDAVLTLFAAAEGFGERMPQAPPAAFARWVRAQDLPADSLAPRGGGDGVAVLTPAGAAGREWDEVVIVGVQDGVWPDLRLRDGVLGAQGLADLLDGRVGARPGDERAAVLSDELRSFAVACSRARRRLLVTAVSDTDEQPSPFVDLVVPPSGEQDDRLVRSPGALDLRGLVARLRARLTAAGAQGQVDAPAARTLARLAAAGVPGADPADWYGLAEPSTDEPLWAGDQLVPLSPSKVETAQRCMLRWALETGGGSGPDTTAANLGTLVHAVAAAHPRGDRAQLQAALAEYWPQLGLGPGWAALALRRKAEAMVDRLARYLAAAGEPIAVEEAFELRTDRAHVHGVADRVEAGDRPGEVVVVDLKTGSTVPSRQDAATNPQLGVYQLAVDAGELGGAQVVSAGARLVYLSQGSAGALREQSALGPEDAGPSWARTVVDTVANQMAAATFTATVNEGCARCPVRRACPLRPEGRQVVAP
jgi:superfamily I DNA/RNA helicase/RecB family exonuclease